MDIRLKRAYDEAAPDDGFRVLVDGLWPRGTFLFFPARSSRMSPNSKLERRSGRAVFFGVFSVSGPACQPLGH